MKRIASDSSIARPCRKCAARSSSGDTFDWPTRSDGVLHEKRRRKWKRERKEGENDEP